MSNKEDTEKEIIGSLKELFTEYVTLQRKVGDKDNFYEFKIPWHSIYKVEGYIVDPEKYPERQEKKKVCSDVWWADVNGKNEGAFLDTPAQVEEKIIAARDKTLAAIKKHRMMII